VACAGPLWPTGRRAGRHCAWPSGKMPHGRRKAPAAWALWRLYSLLGGHHGHCRSTHARKLHDTPAHSTSAGVALRCVPMWRNGTAPAQPLLAQTGGLGATLEGVTPGAGASSTKITHSPNSSATHRREGGNEWVCTPQQLALARSGGKPGTEAVGSAACGPAAAARTQGVSQEPVHHAVTQGSLENCSR
jgi:hypothetical protein